MSLSRASVVPVLLLAGRAAFGQNIAPGYIITAGQDSLRGAIVLHDATAQQRQVDFITAQGSQRQLLDARTLKAYGYTTEQDTVRYIAVTMNLGRTGSTPEALFLRQLVSGPAELYQYRYLRSYNERQGRMAAAFSSSGSAPNGTHASHPALAAPRFPYSLNTREYPPLNAVDARGGTGVALLLRRRGQSNFVIASQWVFPKEATTYFADCPALMPDLQAKRYQPKNLPQLVRRYNSCTSSQ
ncbi:hypothetical protein MON38_13575 [Hymenobacter sp. DH14]|uniref:DUF4136 domain-containing protein n=1 Tax=Hymenobacter cyanobacteriorum TaxID=2926463 RepID=A0A9X2AH69_9BACT|nr:hypothetical protein [Hymenobacter cyanobacteriorum]MCI1188453.1 hypothetical protein [Hymenobacter cyanobacteriorum]